MSYNAVINNRNVLPVGFSQDHQSILWRDVGDCPFRHSFFTWSLDNWEAEHGKGATYATKLSILEDTHFKVETVAPKLFIFHMSRCGSTVLSRAIAQGSDIIVMSEVPVINELLGYLCNRDLRIPINDPIKLQMLRSLIVALGRRRWDSQQSYVVKFSSWNVMLLESIRAAFSGVPCLFVYRDPAEVIIAHLLKPSGFFGRQGCLVSQALTGLDHSQLSAMSQLDYTAKCLDDIMSAGHMMADYYLNYPNINKALLPRLLRYCDIQCAKEQLATMILAFDQDAKSFEASSFFNDTPFKREAITSEIHRVANCSLAARFHALQSSTKNLKSVLQD